MGQRAWKRRYFAAVYTDITRQRIISEKAPNYRVVRQLCS